MKIKTYFFFITLGLLSIAAKAQNIDSLQKTLDTTNNVCTKIDLYTYLAADAIQFNKPQTRQVTNADAAKAVAYVLKAIHFNAQKNDTLALRNNFDCLSQAYFIQKEYAQAKWFNLQSSCISRDRRDVPRIISSLIQMALIKTATKEYDLAQKDLAEAVVLAKFEKSLAQQIAVERRLAALYDKAGDTKAALATAKHYAGLATDLKKENALKMIAEAKAKEAYEKQAAQQREQQYTFALATHPLETQLNTEAGVWMVADTASQPVKWIAFERMKQEDNARNLQLQMQHQYMVALVKQPLRTKLNVETGVWMLASDARAVKLLAAKKARASEKRREAHQNMLALIKQPLNDKLVIENGIWNIADQSNTVTASATNTTNAFSKKVSEQSERQSVTTLVAQSIETTINIANGIWILSGSSSQPASKGRAF